MRLTRHRVLLVEDEMLIAISIEDVLVEAGCEVVGPAATVDAALALLRNGQKLDAALLDMNLDGQSALPVADTLAENSIPFLVLTGYGPEALAGAHQHVPVLPKPFDHGELTRALRRLLDSD
jgi:CheY-like chemotaxis protein